MPLSLSRYSIALLSLTFLMSFSTSVLLSADKPPLTLDEFFDAVHIREIEISPHGESVVIETERADWNASIFRHDLWLYRAAGPGSSSGPESLIMLTRSGHDHDAQWSPDGRWIAFLSGRTGEVNPEAEAEGGGKPKEVSQLYRISPQGGEPLRLTSGDVDVHAFAWSADSKRIYFATVSPAKSPRSSRRSRNEGPKGGKYR